MATIEQTAQLNKLLKEQNKILEAQAKIMKAQSLAVKTMVEAMSQMPVTETSESFRQMNEVLKEAEQSIESLGKTDMSKVTEGAEKATDGVGMLINKIKKIPKSTSIAAGAAIGGFRGITKGITIANSVMGSLIGNTLNLTGSLFNLTTSILSVPFKVFNALMEEASNLSGVEFRQAIENTRKQFGELATNEGKAVIQGFRNLRGELSDTGLSVRRVLGRFSERLNHLRELATNLGPTFSIFRNEIERNGEAIIAYQKGLGLSEEGMRALADRAIAAGTSMAEQGRQITTMAYQMGEAFGINGKLISRDVGTMMSDFANFGTLGIKTMTQVATYTRKLGLEMKDLQGVIGKFDNFEEAANAAAQLNQAFGIQIDTIGLLKDQDPASRFDKLRKSFLATGKSVENLTRQELGLLAQQTGLSEKAVKLGFANRNMGYEDVQKQADKAKDKQLTQAEAMEKLSMSIERMVKQGEKHVGFWDTFVKGLARGVRWSRPFRKMLISLKRALNATFFAGIHGGRQLVKLWPGLSDLFEGFTGFFKDLGNFNKKAHARGFFKDFSRGMIEVVKGKKDLTSFFDEMKEKLENIFDSKHIKKIKESFFKIFEALGKGVAAGIKFLVPKMADGVRILVDIIRDPSKVLAGAQGATEGFSGFLINTLGPAFEAIKEVWPDLRDALGELISLAWVKVKPYLIDAAWKAFAIYSQITFWSGIFGTIKGAVAGAAGKILSGKILGKASGLTKKGGIIGSVAQQVMGDPKDIQKITSSVESQKSFTKSFTSLGKGANWKSFGTMAAKMAIGLAAIAATVSLMAEHAKLLIWQLKGVKREEMLNAGIVITAMAAMYGEAALVLAGAAGIGALITLSGGVGAIGMAAGITAMAGTIILMAEHAEGIIGQTRGINPSEMAKASSIIGSMVAMYSGAALVLAEASAIGIFSGFGLISANGLSQISNVIMMMTDKAMEIIESINKMPNGNNLLSKVKIFTSVVSAMTEIASSMGDLLSASSGGLLGGLKRLFVGGDAKKELDKGMEFIVSVMDVISLNVTKVVARMAKISRHVKNVDKAEVLTRIIASISDLTKALMPPTGFSEAFGNMINPGALNDGLNGVQTILDMIKHHIPPIITSILELSKGITKESQAGINAATSIIDTVTKLITSLQPPKQLTDLLTKQVEGESSWTSIFKSDTKSKIDVKGTLFGPDGFMSQMIGALTGNNGILDKIAVFANTITQKITDPAKVKGGIDILSAVVDSISNLTNIANNDKLKDGKVPNMQNLFSTISPNLLQPAIGNIDMINQDYTTLNNMLKQKNVNIMHRVGKIIHEMVKETNELNSELNKVDPVRINSTLKKVGDKIGDHQTYEIKRNDFTVKVDLQVNLDVDEVSKVLSKNGFLVTKKSKQ